MKIKILISSLLIVFLVAFIGSLFTNTGEWYESIKPDITPAGWVFPVVWNILFLLIAIALYLSWIKTKDKKIIGLVFGINFLLNILWSFLFFELQNPVLAFYELIVLWFSILVMVLITSRVSKVAPILLLPYLLWVGFAGILNYLIIV